MYEMRIPAGVTESMVAHVVRDFDVELKPTEEGPIFYGKKEVLENVQDYIVKALNQRLRELEEGGKK